MSEEKKIYPKIVVGVFIFNDKDELFLVKQPKFNNKFTAPGGHVELNEKLEEAIKREVKEETNMDIIDINFINLVEARELEKKYNIKNDHYICLDYSAKAKKTDKIKLNEEGVEYRWLMLEEWLKMEDEVEEYTMPTIKKCIETKVDNFEDKSPDVKALEDKYKRALADYQNLLKQTAKEKSEFSKFANEMLITEIIPVYDNLKIALNHLDEDAKKNGLAEGIKHIAKQLKDVLEANGVEEIKTEGEKFDHNIMEAIEGEGELVKKEVRAGYKLYGKVIMPAKVILE